MEEIAEIIQSFNADFVSRYPAAHTDEITKTEKLLGMRLPDDYIEFLAFSNGIMIDGDEVLGIGNEPYDLFKAYEIEHGHVQNPMNDYLVPFSPDGGGNFYCFDLKANNVVFWVSDYEYAETDQPEVTNDSFTEWFKEVMIDWTTENNGDDLLAKKDQKCT